MVCVYCISLLNDNATSYHILLLLRTGLTCHCHSDNNCAGETECTGLACIIQELTNGVVEQRCTSSVFDSRLCPAWITDKHYCCTTPLCNDITVLRPWLTTTLMPQQTTPLTQIPSTAIVSQADHPSINTVTPVISVTSTLLAVESTHGQSPSSTYMSPMRTTTTTATTTVLGICVCVLRDLCRCIVVRYSAYTYVYIIHDTLILYISIVVP